MIFLYAVVIGILLGYALRGRIGHLAALHLRGLWLVMLALVIQLLIFPLFTPEPVIPYGTAVLHGISYGLVFLWLLLNVRVRPLIVVGVGALLNLVVVFVNGGYMPASPTALAHAGLTSVAETIGRGETYGNIVGMSAATRLNFLGDWIALPRGLPFATAMSVGDAVIMVGLMWLLVRGMRARAQSA
jgi:hypothetical protein